MIVILQVTDYEENDNNDDSLLLLKNIALFYLKLEVKHLIPVSTIQKNVDEMSNMHIVAKNHFLRAVKYHLASLDIFYMKCKTWNNVMPLFVNKRSI